MPKSEPDNRRHDRFDTEVKIHFYVPYELKTKVQFEFRDNRHQDLTGQKFSGITRNISAGGLCFVSDQKLERGDYLAVEVILPNTAKTILMEGEVKWSKANEDGIQFNTGIQITQMSGQAVDQSIYFDQDHQVIWSPVLESVLGNFALLHKKIYSPEQ